MLIVNQTKTATTEDLSLKIYELDTNDYAIYDKYCAWLGTYDTKERAIEVLQEIVKKYSSYLQLNGGPALIHGQMDIQPNIFNIPKIYEMPEE